MIIKEFKKDVVSDGFHAIFVDKPWRKFKRFFKKIYHTAKGIKFLWNNAYYWWDGSFLEQLIVWKLKYMGQKFIDEGMTVSATKYGKEMLIVAQALQDVMDEKLMDSYYDGLTMVKSDSPNSIGGYDLLGTDHKKFLEIERKIQKKREQVYRVIGERIKFWWD